MKTVILAFVSIGSVLIDAAMSPPSDNTLTSWADKLSLVGALGYFLWYFMQDRKETRTMYEDKLKNKDTMYEEKLKLKDAEIKQLYEKILESKK